MMFNDVIPTRHFNYVLLSDPVPLKQKEPQTLVPSYLNRSRRVFTSSLIAFLVFSSIHFNQCADVPAASNQAETYRFVNYRGKRIILELSYETIELLTKRYNEALRNSDLYNAAWSSGMITAIYAKFVNVAKGVSQHRHTLELLKKLPSRDLILCATDIQTGFSLIGSEWDTSDFSDLAFQAAATSGYIETAVSLLGQKAAIHWTLNRFPEAMRIFREFGINTDPFNTVSPFDSTEDVIHESLQLKDFTRRYIRFMYNSHVVRRELCEKNDCLELAWDMTERIKSRLLRSEIVKGNLLALDEKVQKRVRELFSRNKELRLKRTQERLTTGKLSSPTSYDQQIAEIESEISSIIPEYRNLAVETIRPVDIKNLLTPKETMLSFLYTDNQRSVYVWKIEQNTEPIITKLPINTIDLFLGIQSLKKVIEKGVSLDLLSAVMRDYYDKLIKPLGLEPNRRLIIAVDQNLSSLPFDLIPWPISNRQQLMLDVFEIKYVPSASVFYQLRKNNRRRAISEPPYEYQYGGFSYRGQGEDVLYHSDTEVENVSRKFLSPIKEIDAREVDLYKHREELANTRYLHFVTHNKSVKGVDGSFYLSFGGGDGEDGKITSQEIVARLKNHAELVVLSACETAPANDNFEFTRTSTANSLTGRQSSDLITVSCVCSYGESFSNLSGSFFASGSKKLLLTQWRIRDDDVTEEFIRRFFNHLNEGKQAYEALKLTKQLMMKDHPPVSWAGFILAGD